MKLKILFLTLVLSSTGASANCTSKLRIEILKSLIPLRPFYWQKTETCSLLQEAISFMSELLLEERLEEVLAKKANYIGSLPRQLKTAFEEGIFGTNISQPLKIIWNGINTPRSVEAWFNNFVEAAVAEVYLTRSPEVIKTFETNKIIPEEIVKVTLLRRVKRGGFENKEDNIEYIRSPLPANEFGEILKQRKLIIDIPFKNGSHGHFIHFFQVDLMTYLLKSKGMDTSKVGDIYQWMGEQRSYTTSSGEVLNSIRVGWFNFFDSFQTDITEPEWLNPRLEQFLGWR